MNDDRNKSPEPLAVSQIPDTVLLFIFQYLNSREKTRAAKVCRRWRRLCYDSMLWRNVVADLNLSKKYDLVKIAKSLEARRICNINLLSASGGKPMSCLMRMAHHFIETLDLSLSTDFDKIVANCFTNPLPNLRCLNISKNTSTQSASVFESSNGTLYKLCKLLPNLEQLKMARFKHNGSSDHWLLAISDNLPNLKDLDLTDGKYTTPRALSNLFINHNGWGPKLERMCLSEGYHVSSNLIGPVAGYTTTLKHISIGLGHSHSISDLNQLRWFTKLESLQIIWEGGLPASAAQFINLRFPECMPSLIALDMAGLGIWIGNDEVNQIVTSFPHLKVLNLNGCRRVTDTGVNHIATTLKQLQVLGISYCEVKQYRPFLRNIAENLKELYSLQFIGCDLMMHEVRSLLRGRDACPKIKYLQYRINNFELLRDHGGISFDSQSDKALGKQFFVPKSSFFV